MLLFFSLFAFAPRDPVALPSAPVTHLDRHPFEQGRLSAQPRWAAFRQAWAGVGGGGAWYVRWDERSGTPRFLGVPGVPERDAMALARDVAWLAGVPWSELSVARNTVTGDRRIVQLTRRWRGAPVEGDQIALVITRGRIGAVWAQLTPISLSETPRPGERVLPLPGRGRPVLATVTRGETAVLWRDRASNVVLQYDPRRFSTAQVSCEERTVGDDYLTAPARQITVTDAAGSVEITGDDGVTSLSGDLSALLAGPALRVTDNGASITVTGADDLTMVGGVDLPKPAASVLHHTHVVRDWIAGYWPTLTWLDEVIPADVNQTSGGTCNAYYISGTLNFLPGGSCNNLGQIADVIYHEFGHGVHDYVMASGTFASDISEGSADYVSATINYDPLIAPEFAPGWTYLRELDTDRVYPTDVIGESHNDGLIWGSFLWNLRESWVDTYGEADGVEMTDLLFLRTLEQGPQLTDLYEAVLVADDDDGDWSTGTPHDCELLALLEHHGLGPGAIGVVAADYTPLAHQASATTSYALDVTLTSLSAACGGDAPTLRAWYSIDEDARLPVGDDLTTMSGFTELTLSGSDGVYSADLPRAPANARVQYFFALVSADGTDVAYSYGDIGQNLDTFWVGDRAELWCDDLEGDTSAWTAASGLPWMPDGGGAWTSTFVFDAPAGGAFKPDAAWSGSVAALTGVSGEYLPSNVEYLQSPTVSVTSAGLMRLLSYQRMLTVEDAFYDQANLALVTGSGHDTPLWSNPRTEAGVTAFLDADWTTHDVSLERVLESSTELSFAWTLQSDGGLEFGGWAIDDVCVVELDDLEGHYRVRDLVAEPAGATVHLSWSVPWVRPMVAAALVAKQGGWPETVSDGEVLDTVTDPQWGEVRTATHRRGVAGESWYYAVFTEGELRGLDLWYQDVVEGENGAVVSFEIADAPERDTSAPDDTGPGEGEGEGEGEVKPGGCGCSADPASSGGSALAVAGLLGAAVIRRRGARWTRGGRV